VKTRSPSGEKHRLREQLRAELQRLSAEQRAEAGAAVRSRLKRQAVWAQARFVLFYAPFGEEIDVWCLAQEALDNGKLVALPQFDRQQGSYRSCQVRDLHRDVAIGYSRIREPKPGCPVVPLNLLDLVLVPGVGFDRYGRRLGRGQGYYDRLLADVRGTKCGLAFDCQWVTEIPAEPHDVRLDCIVTPSRWWVVA
jgi:5-formyltetrahydrofolate cyclo-ligase